MVAGVNPSIRGSTVCFYGAIGVYDIIENIIKPMYFQHYSNQRNHMHRFAGSILTLLLELFIVACISITVCVFAS